MPKLALIRGEGATRPVSIRSRSAAVRALVEVGADVLLKRISQPRAEEIQRRIDRVLYLFDRVDSFPEALPELRRELDQLETVMRETREAGKRIKRRSI